MGRLKGIRCQETLKFIESEDAMERITEHILTGHGLMDFCVKNGIKRATVRKWIDEDPDRVKQLHSARTMAADAYVELATKVLDEAERDDNGQLTGPGVNLAKYRSDNYKWLASRMDPKTYGDKQTIEVTQRISITSALNEALGRVINGQASRVDDAMLENQMESHV
jgi:hypothetical protein